MTRLLAILAATVWLVGSAWAHDQWADGKPVAPPVRAECCGVSDSHLIAPEDVSRDESGDWHIKGYPSPIPNSQALPSPDGRTWAFYRVYPDGSFSHIYCFFTAMSF